MLNDGVPAPFCAKVTPFPELTLGRERLWQSRGMGVLCGGRGAGCTTKGARQPLARGIKTHPCANHSPR